MKPIHAKTDWDFPTEEAALRVAHKMKTMFPHKHIGAMPREGKWALAWLDHAQEKPPPPPKPVQQQLF